METVQFIFGIHNHQPVGNFDGVFEYACDQSYLPFLQTLEKHPDISMAIHFSGSLIEWLEANRPEVIELLVKLVKRGNIEILGAGFYEPILAMISRNDRIGQIRKMSKYSIERLGYQVHGSWLTERVWEPHLTYSLVESGIDYVVVDDYHFLSAGLKSEALTGYYHTEQEGRELGVFPISQRLRYAMPFEDPQVTIDHLRKYVSEDGRNVLVMADDGEKFGIWPGTYETVYTHGWLERFFSLLEENAEWLKTTTFKEYHRTHRSRGLVYLPTASYFEMSQWTLPTDLGRDLDRLVHDLEDMDRSEETRPFIKGGMWRNFLSKYAESNWMQKRIQDLSVRMDRWEDGNGNNVPDSMRDDLYRAQCNCAFWHGVFGGLYLPHLRHAIFEHLLKAEKAFNDLAGPGDRQVDIDHDGFQEWILRSDKLQVIVSSNAGQIRELDWLPADFNLTNLIQRYSESYHHKLEHASLNGDTNGSIHDNVLTKEEGLQDKLFVDKYARRNVVDHVFDQLDCLEDYYQGKCPEDLVIHDPEFEMEREGNRILAHGSALIHGSACRIEKVYDLRDGALSVQVTIRNLSENTISSNYGSELNFGLLGGDSPDRYLKVNGEKKKPLNSLLADKAVSTVSLTNVWDSFRIELDFRSEAHLWVAPIETISMSEAGFERLYQATSIMPSWPLELSPGARQTFEFAITVSEYR